MKNNAAMEDHWSNNPRFKEALAEQTAQQDMPKIGCVNHDCDKCKAQQQEIDELTAQRDFLADILTRTATATSTKTARFVDAL